jgi:LuxR family maltose regulon positive regulatory protein
MTVVERRGVRRHGLIWRALHAGTARVIGVQAPAGHGKTTLLEQLRAECEQQGYATGWLDLDEGDNDPRRFYGRLEDLIAGMHAQRVSAPHKATRCDEENEVQPDWLSSRLGPIGRPASLFFDDTHLVGAGPTLTLLRKLISRVPEHLKIFFAGRSMHDFGLARLTVTGQAQIIRAHELRFTRHETARYFTSMADLELSGPDLDQIYQQTDGWPAALQLFRLGLRQPSLRRDLQRLCSCPPQELASYLAEHVLNQQSVATREFLLLSSAMSRMCGDLCDAVLDRKDSAAQLAQLESAGLFLRRVDSEPQWFIYHPLFANFLVDQLRMRGADQADALRRRAAVWFAEHDRIEDALEHYLAAGDQGAAADTLERWADRLIPLGQLVTVERWSGHLPMAEIKRRPGLLLKVAWALRFLRRRSRLLPLLDSLRKLPPLARFDNQTDPSLLLTMAAFLEDDLHIGDSLLSRVDISQDVPAGSFRAFELGAVCNVRGYTAMASGDFAAAHQYFARARHFCGPSGTSFTWAYCVSIKSFALIQQGRLQDALSLLRSSLSDRRIDEDESISRASVVAACVTALYEADQLEEARSLFQRFGDVIASTALPDFLVVTFIAMSRVHDASGEPAKALERLDEAEGIAYAQRWPRLGAIVGWERVRREIVRGESDRAMLLAQRVERLGDFSTGSGVPFSEDIHGTAIGLLRLHAMLRDPSEALRMITTALGVARRKGRVHRQIKLLQFAAVAHHRRDAASHSHEYLDEAVRLAAAGGYLRAFLEEGPLFERVMHDHLPELRTHSAEPTLHLQTPNGAFLGQIVHRLRGGNGPVIGAKSEKGPRGSSARSAERFTRREQTLLKLLAALVSTADMAQAMHLSTDGLKFHLKNIYAKLGVRTRMQAVRAARDLELARH